MTENYIKIPDSVLCKKISPSAKILYANLLLLSHKKGYCFASNKYLGELLNVTPRTITRLISVLTKENLIMTNYNEVHDRQIFIK